MQKKRHSPCLLIGLAALAAATDAGALGWNRAPQNAVLGQPLEFAVSLRLDAGEVIEPKCVAAEVFAGDLRLSGARLSVDAGNPEALAIRVSTPTSIDEPVVTVALAIGCPARLSRRFVLLLDPPDLAVPTVAEAPVSMPPQLEPARPLPPVAEAAPAPQPAARIVVAPERPRAAAAPRPPRKVAAAAPHPKAEPKARLQLDAADAAPKAPALAASAVEDAMQAVAQAASAAQAAASAASAAESRFAALERQVAQMRAEAESNREQMAQLRARAAEADNAARWVTPLLAVLALLVGVVIWLTWKLRQAQQQRQQEWRGVAAAGAVPAGRTTTPAVQLPTVNSELMPPVAPTLPAMRDADTVQYAAERTDVLPPRAAVPEPPSSPRDVSIEELLDLEQQAEFFIVLGQDEAAIDLLVDHLRDTGGGSPLPYLKLLEIYRRRSDRDAYERTRSRFNHRFNAYAPEWNADLQQGRSLEDYPGVVPRLQQVWARPMDAMAELEALLFRKSRGQLFELPAYREVLFLYSLARDLMDREAGQNGDVDLLLPMSDGSEFSSTAPNPFLGLERDSVFAGLPEDRPTVPVDLDLTQPETVPAETRPMVPKRIL